jgi:hypothetical protein
MPGIGDDMEGAIQQAPQFLRHFTGRTLKVKRYKLEVKGKGYMLKVKG